MGRAEVKSCGCGVGANAAGWMDVARRAPTKGGVGEGTKGYVDGYFGSGGESISGITIERPTGGVAATLWCWVHKGVEARQDTREAA